MGTDDTKEDDEDEDEEEDEEDEEDFYDSHDEEYSELVEKYMSDNTEDGNLSYFHQLKESEKKQYLEEIKNIYSISASNIPLKFKVLNSDMDLYTKSLAIRNLDKLSEMDISTGEYNKMDQWINGLIQLPFGNYTQLPVTNEDSFEDKRNYIQQTLTNMNQAIYGHMEAKTHILQVIGKWIRNPESLGNVLAIQVKDKLQIAHNYLLPEIYQLFNYTNRDITFTDDVLREIIKTYTGGEEGVRNLKRCLESIVSTLNIYHLTKSEDKEDILDMKIKDFKLPITLTLEHIKDLLKITNGDKPPEHMYM